MRNLSLGTRWALLLSLAIPVACATPNLPDVERVNPPSPGSADRKVTAALRARAEASGQVRVLVRLNIAWQPEGDLTEAQKVAQQARIAAAQNDLLAQVQARGATLVRNYQFVPQLVLNVTPGALDVLEASPLVASVQEDQVSAPTGS
jgi:hypothetical protein